MDNKEKLYEASEDAFFAYLMDEVLEKLGEESLSEAAECSPSEELKKRCGSSIRLRLMTEKERKRRTMRKNALKVAVLVVVFVSVITAAVYSSVPEVRHSYLWECSDEELREYYAEQGIEETLP